MKKIIIVLAALTAFMAVSCYKEEVREQDNKDLQEKGMVEVTITANIENQTKTSYTDDGDNPGTQLFSWVKGDQISVMCSDNVYRTLTAVGGGSSTQFTGSIPVGVTLTGRAYFPADANHSENYINIPKSKDLTAHPSADLPMIAINSGDTYSFAHCSGAALLTIDNIPDDIVSVEVSVENSSLKLSGLFEVKTKSAAPNWYWSPEGKDGDNSFFIRKVLVSNHKAQIYIPYSCHATDGNMYATSNLIVTGYKSDESSEILVSDKSVPALGKFERAHVKPLKTLILSQLGKINWDEISGYSDSEKNYLEYKVTSDDYFVYFYSKVKKAQVNWGSGGSSGTYIYYGIDTDNGATGTDYWGSAGIWNTYVLIYPYGSGETINSNPSGAIKGVSTPISCSGTIGTGESATVETEVAVLRTDLNISKGIAVRVGSYASSHVSQYADNFNVTL